MRVVLDTNVLISALIKTGKPRDLLFKLLKTETLILSDLILEEFFRTAKDPRIAKYVSERETIAFLNLWKGLAEMTTVKVKFKVVKEDPTDDVILRTAYDGKADFIVSGDNHLVSMGEFRGIKIVTVNEMLNLLTH